MHCARCSLACVPFIIVRSANRNETVNCVVALCNMFINSTSQKRRVRACNRGRRANSMTRVVRARLDSKRNAAR